MLLVKGVSSHRRGCRISGVLSSLLCACAWVWRRLSNRLRCGLSVVLNGGLPWTEQSAALWLSNRLDSPLPSRLQSRLRCGLSGGLRCGLRDRLTGRQSVWSCSGLSCGLLISAIGLAVGRGVWCGGLSNRLSGRQSAGQSKWLDSRSHNTWS